MFNKLGSNVTDQAFNSLTDTGLYAGFIDGSSACPCKGKWSYIFVEKIDASNIMQVVISAQNTAIVTSRYCNQGTWGNWTSMSSGNTAGAPIDISSHASSSNKYTTSTDGYVQLQGTNAKVILANGNSVMSSNGDLVGIYIKKGMEIYLSGTITLANFIPLS